MTLAQILVAACEMEFILLLVVRGDESWRCKILKQVSIKVFSHLSACINLCKKLCISVSVKLYLRHHTEKR